MDLPLPGSPSSSSSRAPWSVSSSSSRAPRNDNNQTQNLTGGGNQRIPPPNPPPPCFAYRIIAIQNQMEIVSVLSATATRYGQAFYIGHGTGYVSQATYFPLVVSRYGHQQFRNQNVPAEIDYLSGWFHPRLAYQNPPLIPSRLDNGVLHVNLRHVRILESVYLATSLIASGPVEVNVLFVCGPGSTVQPSALGGPRELYTIIAQPE